MSRHQAAAAGRAAAKGVVPALMAGDAVSFVVFSALGRAEHQTGLAPLQILFTALPFLIAWFPVALWLKAFQPRAVASVWAAVKSVFLPWLLTWPLALQLRALILDRNIPFSFAAVVFAMNLALLALWRGSYAFFRQRRRAKASG